MLLLQGVLHFGGMLVESFPNGLAFELRPLIWCGECALLEALELLFVEVVLAVEDERG